MSHNQPHSQATKEMMSHNRKGKVKSAEWKAKISTALKGKKHDRVERICENCGNPFMADARQGKFCSAACSKGSRGVTKLRSKPFAKFKKVCEICGSPDNLCGDHDHKTNNPRGILCKRCNLGIGNLRDDPKLVFAAAKYLGYKDPVPSIGKVYLAGPITSLSWTDATVWRTHVASELEPLGIICYSPLRFKNYLSHLNNIADSYPEFGLSSPRGITTRDRWDAMRCDVLFVNFLGAQKVSIGTVMEIAWADSKRIPIVIAMEENNVHRHSMLVESAGYVCPTLEEAIHTTKALLINNGTK